MRWIPYPLLVLMANPSMASEQFSISDFGISAAEIGSPEGRDATTALQNAIYAANRLTAHGEPACVYIPTGRYLITKPMPEFARAGCIQGNGSTQSIITVDCDFSGDLLSWSEAWSITTAGPRVQGLRIMGCTKSEKIANALVFYDRIDKAFIDDVEIDDFRGRALYSGIVKHTSQAYMRESQMRNLRFFNDGAPDVSVLEFNSQGETGVDGTNEVSVSQLDIYGSNGPSITIKNESAGSVRDLTFSSTRIEGKESGNVKADLIDISQANSGGSLHSISLFGLELIDPYIGYAAMRISSTTGPAPYNINVYGWIGGGVPRGQGLQIDAGRSSQFHFSAMHTYGTNFVIGPYVTQILIDGAGLEDHWTFKIDPTSKEGVSHYTVEQLKK